MDIFLKHVPSTQPPAQPLFTYAEQLRISKQLSKTTEVPSVLLIALRRIAKTGGGLAKVAKAAGLGRESLYRAQSVRGNPRLRPSPPTPGSLGTALLRLPFCVLDRKRSEPLILSRPGVSRFLIQVRVRNDGWSTKAPSGGRSAWTCGHERAMSRCRLPILNPLLPNAVGSFDEFVARAVPVLDNNDNPGVEPSLGVINIG